MSLAMDDDSLTRGVINVNSVFANKTPDKNESLFVTKKVNAFYPGIFVSWMMEFGTIDP